MKFLIIAGLGATGVLLRYGLSSFLPSGGLSWAVLTANIVGSFFAGVIFTLYVTPGDGAESWATFILIGLLGGLTTFSSYSMDTVRLLESSAWSLALLNVVLNNFLSIGACYIGLKVTAYI